MNKVIYMLFLLLSSCISNDNLFRGHVVHIDSFKDEYHLQGTKLSKVDSVGVGKVEFFSSYLITTMFRLPYCAKVYRQNTLEQLGDMFRTGTGPDEFLQFDILNQKHDSLLWIEDYPQKTIYAVNMEASLKTGRPIIMKRVEFKKIIDPFVTFYCNDSLLLIKSLEHGKGMQYMKYNPHSNNPVLQEIPMYNAVFEQWDMNHMMGLADCMKPDGKKVAVLTGILNQIDILDIENPLASISITTDQKKITLENIRNSPEELYRYYITLPRCNNTMVIALHQNPNNNVGEFHVVTWEGKGVCKITVKEGHIRDFNIDWNRGHLYCINDDGIVYRYDITQVLAANLAKSVQ